MLDINGSFREKDGPPVSFADDLVSRLIYKGFSSGRAAEPTRIHNRNTNNCEVPAT